MNDFAIDIRGLTKKFGENIVVNNLSLQVERGSVFGFLGSNGSGKTTTIRMICGLLMPTSGTGRCLDLDIQNDSEEIRSRIGYMAQKFCLYEQLTVIENLRFIGEVYQLSDLDDRISEQLKYLRLENYKDRRARDLSGGWKQRLSLASCLLHSPEILFLDEPTAGVDPKARKEFWDYLHEIAIEKGTTILVTTHYMDEAEKCTNLAYINQGNLLYTGTTTGIIPFSKIISYVSDIQRQQQAWMTSEIGRRYPAVTTSFVNNQLRISSRDQEILNEILERYPDSQFTRVAPSFEEVFIGLIS
ncbi:ABC transporter ATP-binding protein [Fluviibacter phosphoraccumulans]|uniref:ABC transporter ATP-binding protein n=1 Tax=Fluviibacter phosphoraccumulans TaxID=1751046 RepID=A0A7R6RF69_9RHOO|nr:ABC transporter ATP-binding protein [Fluviibacter phosphoraccumulans]BBU69966.1 ABC transporter ATP-binding protein [Fluviibacter phosphoraccumulans]